MKLLGELLPGLSIQLRRTDDGTNITLGEMVAAIDRAARLEASLPRYSERDTDKPGEPFIPRRDHVVSLREYAPFRTDVVVDPFLKFRDGRWWADTLPDSTEFFSTEASAIAAKNAAREEAGRA